jgi:hypothetical protein
MIEYVIEKGKTRESREMIPLLVRSASVVEDATLVKVFQNVVKI